MKYVRLYGFDHKRTSDQFQTAWTELRQAAGSSSGLLLGVAGSKLLLDGVALETGQAERGFTDLLTAAGIASLQFFPNVAADDFKKLVEAFAAGKPVEVLKQIKATLPQGANAPIRLNEVRYVEDKGKDQPDMAAHLTARALDSTAEKVGAWLKDPQKLLQLILASQGVDKGSGAPGAGGPGSSTGTGTGSGGGDEPGAGLGVAPLQETEVVSLVRWVTQLANLQADSDPDAAFSALQAGMGQFPANSVNALQQALAAVSQMPTDEKDQGTMLLKLAENLAIRFALERYDKGEVKVNAVREMIERMSGEMDNLRKILHTHEETMARSGMTVETHAEILDRQFWAAMPERGKKGVLLSPDAYCIPARNVRSYAEELLGRGDRELAAKILRQYACCICCADPDGRRKTALGLVEIADLYTKLGAEHLFFVVQQAGEQVGRGQVTDLQPLVGAAFVRVSQEAANSKHYPTIARSLDAIRQLQETNPSLAKELRPRVAVEGRIREFVEDALRAGEVPLGLIDVLQRSPQAAAEHIAVRFGQCSTRVQCETLLGLLSRVGQPAVDHLRTLTLRPPAEALIAIGVRSRLDFAALEKDLLPRVMQWSRLQQDELVRQLSFGGASERGGLLMHLLPVLDPLIQPIALDEVGLSGDRDVAEELAKLAQGQGIGATSGYVRVKAVEALARMHEDRALEILAKIATEKSLLSYKHPDEIRVAAAQALMLMSPQMGQRIAKQGGIPEEDLQLGIGVVNGEWARPRRYQRVKPPKPLSALAITPKGRTLVNVTSMSLGGGLASREARGSVGPEAVFELTMGMRRLHMNVLVRENRARELTFEILNIELEDLGRLRKLLLKHRAVA
jgi:hypothetical protein